MDLIMDVLRSEIDASVNFVEKSLIGFLEARYVRRVNDYFICYLSSSTGCNRGCKFCHLTITKQTLSIDSTPYEFQKQAETIFDEYEDSGEPAKVVHFNFMARGEILANKYILTNSTEILSGLGKKAMDRGLIPKFNVSTIMPVTLKQSLSEIFPLITPTIYYSAYSADKRFRDHWLPAAMDFDESLRLLKDYQEKSKKIVKFHCAFIAGENDSNESVIEMMEAIKASKIMGESNIVRYNPYSAEQGVESERLDIIEDLIGQYMPVKRITRVGNDVAASCGTFVDKNGNV
jgi:23S rRNA (adenine2503-C2)-methyltransferase